MNCKSAKDGQDLQYKFPNKRIGERVGEKTLDWRAFRGHKQNIRLDTTDRGSYALSLQGQVYYVTSGWRAEQSATSSVIRGGRAQRPDKDLFKTLRATLE